MLLNGERILGEGDRNAELETLGEIPRWLVGREILIDDKVYR